MINVSIAIYIYSLAGQCILLDSVCGAYSLWELEFIPRDLLGKRRRRKQMSIGMKNTLLQNKEKLY